VNGKAPAIVLAIDIADAALADRLASLLGAVAGIRLAAPDEEATVTLVSRELPAVVEPDHIELTARERDVLLLMARPTRRSRDGSAYPSTPRNSTSVRCSTSSTPPDGPTRWRMRRGSA
jgi:hypothetical protein